LKKNITFIFELLRIKQWVKNTFIFFPLMFSGRLFQIEAIQNTLLTFLGFCLVSSGLYILNDYRDREFDRLHPQKRHRPLASLEINPWGIAAMIIALITAGSFVCSLVDPGMILIALTYFLANLTYNFYSKNIVLLDVLFLAFGFQIRIWAGAFASNVEPSIWLQMCVFILALFLGFTKRRQELFILGEKAAEHRRVLSHYTQELLDQIILICSTLAIVFYGLYCISPDIQGRMAGNNMVYSIVFVIYGIFRYLYLAHVKKMGGEPGEVLATDAPSLVNVLLWILYIMFLIYNPIR